MAKILVTGVSGLLGANLAIAAAEMGHEVTGVFHSHSVRSERFHTLWVDLGLSGEAKRVVEAERPDWIVHCAAWTDIDACEADPKLALMLNRDMAESVAAAALDTGAQLVHISTDAVFDGRQGNYQEDDETIPINVYGRTKLEGEKAVEAAHRAAAIIRTNIFGWSPVAKPSLAEFFLAHLERGEPCNGFSDVRVTPLLVNDLAGVLLLVLSRGLSGTFHVGGRECISKYDFGVRIAEAFGLDPALIRRCSVDESRLRAPRGKELCLCVDKVRAALGIDLPSVSESLGSFRRLRDQGYTATLRELGVA